MINTNEDKIIALVHENHTLLNALLWERILTVMDLTEKEMNEHPEQFANPVPNVHWNQLIHNVRAINSTEVESVTTYMLFGEKVCQAYHNEDFDKVLDMIKKGAEYDIYEHLSTGKVADLMLAADGWTGYAIITRQEYNQIEEIYDIQK